MQRHGGTWWTSVAQHKRECSQIIITPLSDIRGANVLKVWREAAAGKADKLLAFDSTDGDDDIRAEHELREAGLTGWCCTSEWSNWHIF